MKILFSFTLLFVSVALANISPDLTTCEKLRGMKFTSYNDHPIGERPDGEVAMGKWTVEFDGALPELRATEHDYGVDGKYSCDNAEGRIELDKQGVGKWIGYFQPDVKILLFQGNWYKQQ